MESYRFLRGDKDRFAGAQGVHDAIKRFKEIMKGLLPYYMILLLQNAKSECHVKSAYLYHLGHQILGGLVAWTLAERESGGS